MSVFLYYYYFICLFVNTTCYSRIPLFMVYVTQLTFTDVGKLKNEIYYSRAQRIIYYRHVLGWEDTVTDPMSCKFLVRVFSNAFKYLQWSYCFNGLLDLSSCCCFKTAFTLQNARTVLKYLDISRYGSLRARVHPFV